VQGLTAKDFHLFEDGQEQAVQSVKREPPAFQVVRDNLGKHPETIGSGGGRWGYPDQPETYPNLWLSWPQYVIAYIPPVSPPASCHKIQVKVGRPNSIVWTSSEYCNTKQSATTDPLKEPLNKSFLFSA